MNEPLRRLGVVVFAMSLAAAIHVAWLAPHFAAPMPTALLLLCVFASALYAGLWPGLVATAICLVASLLAARHAAVSDESARVVLFAAAGGLASLLAQAARHARARSDADRLALRRQMQERAEAELRLASSEVRFRTVIDTLPDLVFTADASGGIRPLNHNWLATSSSADPAPTDLFALVHPDDLAGVRSAWDEANADGLPLDFRARLRARDTSYRWALARAQLSAAPDASEAQWFGVIIDIDKAVAAERALRDSDERLQLALAATGLGTFEMDFATGAQRFNETARSMLGFANESKLTRALFEARIDPEDLEQARAAIARARAGGEGAHFYFEYRFQRPDNVWRWVAMRGKCFADITVPGEPATRCLGTLHDVTDRRAADGALAEAAERLRLALEATDLGMWDYDFAADTAVCSPRVHAIAGLPVDTPISKAAWLALVLPEDAQMLIEHARDALVPGSGTTSGDEGQGSLDIEYRLRRATDGVVRWVALTGRVAFDGSEAMRPVRATGTLRDVTRRRESIELLRNSEERFRLAAEALDGLIYDYDPAADYVERSRGLHEVTGFGAGDVPASGAWWRSRIHSDDLPRVQAAVDDALAHGLRRVEREYRVRHRDGHWVHVNDRALLVWRNGAVGRMLGVVTDVTERRRIERVLRDADQRKDEFLAVLAHELRNPLAPIRNAVQVITRASDPEPISRATAILERQVGQMVRLIDDLLDVSRIAQGKLKLRRESVALTTVVDAAIEIVQPLLSVKNQTFERTLPDRRVTLQADSVRLSQVIANLLHNAIKYTPRDGRISLVAAVDSDARSIEMRLTDSGIGLAPESLESIFTMFSQVRGDAEEAGRHEGLGIGLALARAVVILHGGTVHATSAGLGLGAQFVVRLPLSDAGSQESAEMARRDELPRCRVLVVDDNRDSAESLAAVLRLDQHEVFVAYGGREALQVAERERPDLILLDIGMPDIDGYEVARMLRADGSAMRARIVALSGFGQAGDREKSLAAGCDGHLVKPVAVDDLAAWVNPL